MLMDSMSKVSKLKACRVFAMVRAAQEYKIQFSLASSPFLDDFAQDPEFAIKELFVYAEMPLSCSDRLETARRRLNGCCRGLVEASYHLIDPRFDGKHLNIGFTHRSIPEVLYGPDVCEVLHHVLAGFDRIVALPHLFLADIRSVISEHNPSNGVELSERCFPGFQDTHCGLSVRINGTAKMLSASQADVGSCQVRLWLDNYFSKDMPRISDPQYGSWFSDLLLDHDFGFSTLGMTSSDGFLCISPLYSCLLWCDFDYVTVKLEGNMGHRLDNIDTHLAILLQCVGDIIFHEQFMNGVADFLLWLPEHGFGPQALLLWRSISNVTKLTLSFGFKLINNSRTLRTIKEVEYGRVTIPGGFIIVVLGQSRLKVKLQYSNGTVLQNTGRDVLWWMLDLPYGRSSVADFADYWELRNAARIHELVDGQLKEVERSMGEGHEVSSYGEIEVARDGQAERNTSLQVVVATTIDFRDSVKRRIGFWIKRGRGSGGNKKMYGSRYETRGMAVRHSVCWGSGVM
ncbi:P-loop containing nucleoside triphosphate hydrolase [Zalerion maritima]|uniref:P-loop containing nucleoside triphosphate hydrolase n=1 Tax=Zalerion maritima TaxID=339359 RepID=A0AAD5RS68_9PEZI|nr:P-loop containing nucleoside triphosphate hydrolase [Zalerion maritima]